MVDTPDLFRARKCGRKKLYPDQASTTREVGRLCRINRVPFSAYRCPLCNGWHIGRDRGPVKGKLRQARKGGV